MQDNLIYRSVYIDKKTKIRYDGYYLVTDYLIYYDDDYDICHMSTAIILDNPVVVIVDNLNSFLKDKKETRDLYELYEKFDYEEGITHPNDFWCALEEVRDREALILDLSTNPRDWFQRFRKYSDRRDK